MKVMVVDDSGFMRRVLVEIIGEMGMDVVEAKDGASALDLYEREKPDIVTLDIVMPGMNGLETLKKLREKDPKSRVIMVSALSEKNMVKEAIEAGAVDFIVKPFRKEDVKAALADAMKGMA